MLGRVSIIMAIFLLGCASPPAPLVPVAAVGEQQQDADWQPTTAPPPPPVTRAEVQPLQPRMQRASPPVEKPRPTPTQQVRLSAELTDAAIVSAIISRSRASYPGNCGCPDDRDRAGRRCGGRSAYSRAGGYSVVCYPSDVTPQMVANFRSR